MRAYLTIEGPGNFFGPFDGYKIRHSLPYQYVHRDDKKASALNQDTCCPGIAGAFLLLVQFTPGLQMME